MNKIRRYRMAMGNFGQQQGYRLISKRHEHRKQNQLWQCRLQHWISSNYYCGYSAKPPENLIDKQNKNPIRCKLSIHPNTLEWKYECHQCYRHNILERLIEKLTKCSQWEDGNKENKTSSIEIARILKLVWHRKKNLTRLPNKLLRRLQTNHQR